LSADFQHGFRAKPDFPCTFEVSAGAPLPVGCVGENAVVRGYIDSGFALAAEETQEGRSALFSAVEAVVDSARQICGLEAFFSASSHSFGRFPHFFAERLEIFLNGHHN
jgi:hypothetical protein